MGKATKDRNGCGGGSVRCCLCVSLIVRVSFFAWFDFWFAVGLGVLNESPLPSVFRFLFSSSLRFLCYSLYFWGAEGTEAHRFVLRSFLD